MKYIHLANELKNCIRNPGFRASLVMLGVSSGILLTIFLLLYWPVASRFAELSSRLEEGKRELRMAQYSAELSKTISHALKQVQIIDEKLDASVTQTMLIRDIAVLAHRNKVKIVSESYEDGKSSNGYLPLLYQLNMQGGYAELRNFISGLQNLPSLTIASEAMLSSMGDANVIKAQLNIVTYRRVLKADSK